MPSIDILHITLSVYRQLSLAAMEGGGVQSLEVKIPETTRTPHAEIKFKWRIIQMSGTRGKSGGARFGAGRKKKLPQILKINSISNGFLLDPKPFLLHVMNDNAIDVKLRVDAAKVLMPFMYNKYNEKGKKDIAMQAAKVVSKGRFSPRHPPIITKKYQ